MTLPLAQQRVAWTPVAILLALLLSIASAAVPASFKNKTCKDLHDAAFNVDLTLVKYLIEVKKCNPNLRKSRDPDPILNDGRAGWTPLLLAVYSAARLPPIGVYPYVKGQAQVVRYLLSKGANPNTPFPEYAGITGYTPLHYTAFDGDMNLVPILIAYGAKVNARDQRGYTPLHAAARCFLGQSCDDCNPPKGTKINEAIRSRLGARPVIAHLLKYGANILARTKTNRRPLDIIPAPCFKPSVTSPYETWYEPPKSCKEFGVKTCADLCKPAGQRLKWPEGTCKKTYFFVKAKTEEALKKRKPSPPPPKKAPAPKAPPAPKKTG